MGRRGSDGPKQVFGRDQCTAERRLLVRRSRCAWESHHRERHNSHGEETSAPRECRGIETLRNRGPFTPQHCTQGQGYIFSRHLAAATMAHLLQMGIAETRGRTSVQAWLTPAGSPPPTRLSRRPVVVPATHGEMKFICKNFSYEGVVVEYRAVRSRGTWHMVKPCILTYSPQSFHSNVGQIQSDKCRVPLKLATESAPKFCTVYEPEGRECESQEAPILNSSVAGFYFSHRYSSEYANSP